MEGFWVAVLARLSIASPAMVVMQAVVAARATAAETPDGVWAEMVWSLSNTKLLSNF